MKALAAGWRGVSLWKWLVIEPTLRTVPAVDTLSERDGYPSPYASHPPNYRTFSHFDEHIAALIVFKSEHIRTGFSQGGIER